MAKLVFDIETVGEDFDSFDETTKRVLTKWIERESENEEEYKHYLDDVKNRTGLSPLTGSVVAIGVLDADRDQGAVYFQAPGEEVKESEDGGIKFQPMDEKAMLTKFWEIARQYDEFISFNGRSFDVPFLMLRSAINKVRPSKNLMGNRYLERQRDDSLHIDLFDQLNFQGAVHRRDSLHMYTRAFGIDSPKAGGVAGDDVASLFKDRKFIDIARYNAGDLKATRDLYRYWHSYLRF
jgi:DNA polymerase elongation subunit (family B)